MITQTETHAALAAETSAHARTAAELAFWKHQAIWHRAYVLMMCSGNANVAENVAAWEDQAGRDLEQARTEENAERFAHAEARKGNSPEDRDAHH